MQQVKKYLWPSLIAVIGGTAAFTCLSAALAFASRGRLRSVILTAAWVVVPICFGQMLMILGERVSQARKYVIRSAAVFVAGFGAAIILLQVAIALGAVPLLRVKTYLVFSFIGSAVIAMLVCWLLLAKMRSSGQN